MIGHYIYQLYSTETPPKGITDVNAEHKWWSYINEVRITPPERDAVFSISMSEIKFADPKGLAHYSTPSELTPYIRETRKFVLRKIQYLIWTVLRPQSDFQVPASSLPDSLYTTSKIYREDLYNTIRQN